MQGRNPTRAVIATALVLAFARPGLAQGGHPGANRAPQAAPPRPSSPPENTRPPNGRGPQTPIDQFETMSPEQRQKVLNQLPRAKRAKLEERLQKFNDLPPEQQQSLKSLYTRLNQLPPERQATVRKAVSRFSEQPAERQQAIRAELQNMASLSEQDRLQLLRSSGFRKKFSRKEQGIVRDMAPLLPVP